MRRDGRQWLSYCASDSGLTKEEFYLINKVQKGRCESVSNTIELWEVNKLINKKFFIPTYQRGYRWDVQQVKDLLNDLYEFKNSANTSEGEFYCLQPIVVKKRGDVYDVIDGQQRLTTILIILKYLNQRRTYRIDYATREGSEKFLDEICDRAKEEIVEKNIDFYFMKTAFVTVEKWFDTMTEEHEEYSLETEMTTYLLRHCKVIWYEVDDVDAESIFTRLNIGKIPLTNAELIKALLLKESNYSGDSKVTYLRQMEIANEWDMIENTLQDDKVWYFINRQYSKQPEVRIEYIFDSINYSDEEAKGEYATFYKFNEMLKTVSVNDVWKKVKDYFQIIMEWYNNQVYYHLIGFITSRKLNSIEDLIYEYRACNYSKSEFLGSIKDTIKKKMERIGDISILDYNDNADDINTVLLLFNVITVMNKSNAYSRFRFDEYQKNEWSLEHIHAQNAEGILNSSDAMLSWIDEHLASFKTFVDQEDSNKYEKIVGLLENFDRKHITQDSFTRLFDEICKKIESDYGTDLNNISNLALLDRNTNSALSNSFFDVKRSIIVDKDRNGEFIPICTRNVFLKYYSEDASQIHYWSQKDRADYLQAIKNTLGEFLQEG